MKELTANIKTIPFDELEVKIEGNKTFYFEGKRIEIPALKDEFRTIHKSPKRKLEGFVFRENTPVEIIFATAEERYYFERVQNNYFDSIEDIIRLMKGYKLRDQNDKNIISELKKTNFFRRLKNVRLESITKAKLYKDTIYMNGEPVILNQEEKEIFEGLIEEAQEYFANHTDSSLVSIANSRIIGEMFRHYFPMKKKRFFCITNQKSYNEFLNSL